MKFGKSGREVHAVLCVTRENKIVFLWRVFKTSFVLRVFFARAFLSFVDFSHEHPHFGQYRICSGDPSDDESCALFLFSSQCAVFVSSVDYVAHLLALLWRAFLFCLRRRGASSRDSAPCDADLFDDMFFSSERLSSWFVHAGLFAVGKNVGICDSRFVRYFYLWHGRGGRQQPCRRL